MNLSIVLFLIVFGTVIAHYFDYIDLSDYGITFIPQYEAPSEDPVVSIPSWCTGEKDEAGVQLIASRCESLMAEDVKGIIDKQMGSDAMTTDVGTHSIKDLYVEYKDDYKTYIEDIVEMYYDELAGEDDGIGQNARWKTEVIKRLDEHAQDEGELEGE